MFHARPVGSGFAVLLGLFMLSVDVSLAHADQLQLTGVIRDLKRGDKTGGHPDFETAGAKNMFGHVTGMVTYYLSEDRRPVYNPTRPASKDTMTSADRFNQWYRDTPNVNISSPLTLTLSNNQSNPGGVYTFHDSSFWPIDGKHFGNQSLNHNFHFTFELHTTFTYSPGQVFTFIGDDDVWVYVNGVRTIDLGGVHQAITGSFRLFDGKAFVEKSHFPLGSVVQEVSTAMKLQLVQKWANLGMGGTCPFAYGDRYIDLQLTGGAPDARAAFTGDNVEVWASDALRSVVLKFSDGTQQRFDNLSLGTHGIFTGTGAYDGKAILGCWVKAGSAEQNYSHYLTRNGSTSINCTLDFFFAERHTTESNFRIDTTMLLETVDPNTISPLYD
ncbi:MAG: fibro-slime domain-containing protein [Phycisphaeraceae bacterium]|nr:fibro-slime domain-containing protein [Phycisphaeraceae bacterium]